MKLILAVLLTLAGLEQVLQMTDFTCMNRCTRAGYSYGYCSKMCEY